MYSPNDDKQDYNFCRLKLDAWMLLVYRLINKTLGTSIIVALTKCLKNQPSDVIKITFNLQYYVPSLPLSVFLLIWPQWISLFMQLGQTHKSGSILHKKSFLSSYWSNIMSFCRKEFRLPLILLGSLLHGSGRVPPPVKRNHPSLTKKNVS